jgi:transposase InsO family protein
MDFMADQLYSGERFRPLTIVDNFSRESPAIRVGQRLTGDHVVEVVAQLAEQRRILQAIRVDKGPEFISKSLDWWAYWNRVRPDFSRPGKAQTRAFSREPARGPRGPHSLATTRCPSTPGRRRLGGWLVATGGRRGK